MSSDNGFAADVVSRKRRRVANLHPGQPYAKNAAGDASEQKLGTSKLPLHSEMNSICGLILTEQPEKYGRFRYKTEGRQNVLRGRTPGSFPTVTVNPALAHLITDGLLVECELVTRFPDSDGNHVKHWHRLEGKNGEPPRKKIESGMATFTSLVVSRTKSDVRRNADDQRAVRLHFYVRFADPDRGSQIASVTSLPVFSTELKIDRVVPHYGDRSASTDCVLLTSKINKKTSMIRLTDVSPSVWIPPTSSGWSLDQMNRPTYTISSKELTIHHQFAVAATFPPYFNPTAVNDKEVEVRIIDTVDVTESPPQIYTYVTGCKLCKIPAGIAGKEVGKNDKAFTLGNAVAGHKIAPLQQDILKHSHSSMATTATSSSALVSVTTTPRQELSAGLGVSFDINDLESTDIIDLFQ